MTKNENFDVQKAHRFFSTTCFNRVWGMLDKSDRAAVENEQMIGLCQTSLWHWTQREDCTNQNLSIGSWQLSRVFAVTNRASEAMAAAQRCLEFSRNEPPFYLGYAYEALARAAAVSGEHALKSDFLELAREQIEQIANAEERDMLLNELATIE